MESELPNFSLCSLYYSFIILRRLLTRIILFAGHTIGRGHRFYYFWAEFWYSKYLIVLFVVRFGGISGSFRLAMGIFARLRLVKILKIRTMARLNSPNMPPKRIKKVRLGIKVVLSVHLHVMRVHSSSLPCPMEEDASAEKFEWKLILKLLLLYNVYFTSPTQEFFLRSPILLEIKI